MEFKIDGTLVESIASQESAQARRELDELGPIEALRRSCERHDERLARAADAKTLACKAGCYWCCYFSVDVRPVEVFNILEFIATHFSEAEKSRVRTEIAANAALLKTLSELERAQKNIKCPFLSDGRCTIYAARPQTCRNYHATDVRGCQKSFEEPGNLDIDPDFAPFVYQTGGAHVESFSKTMRDAGYDFGAYELNTALQSALADPKLHRDRFDARQKTFPTLECTEVGYEFMDDS